MRVSIEQGDGQWFGTPLGSSLRAPALDSNPSSLAATIA